jgi:CRISPR-associated endonuclease/helicase Cas3
MPEDFNTFFSAAFEDGRQPYDYQKRLACGERREGEPEAEWLSHGATCQSRLISVPTGLGKTAAVVLAWLWNRQQSNPTWPRRLVYCLPMRSLVEQTADAAQGWVDRLHEKQMITGKKPRVVILMGGEEIEGDAKDWDLYPEEDAILIGTQDMLLSRALNRGYGMSRYRWPMHFGLLNNDCLWVLDETQLMGVGVETSAQLAGFRQKWTQHMPCLTWWMSATLEDARLATVDHPAKLARLTLEEKDQQAVQHCLAAVKRLQKAPLSISKNTKPADLATFVREKHIEGQLTLVIVNRVQRAQELYEALRKDKSTSKASLALVHSRFRAPDREAHQGVLIEGKGDRIVIATQAVEAGVDVSARVLITELAPWSSLVQRFGRCNRGGEFNAEGADIHWLDVRFEKDAEVAPYTLDELKDAREMLTKLEGKSASPTELTGIVVVPPPVIRPVIRRRDLIDIFDTTPDIAGHDLDISRYIREDDDTDVQVFWRDLSATDFKPSAATDAPTRDELCRVAVHRFKEFLKKLTNGPEAWIWDGLLEEWTAATHARAGATYLLDHRAGGYDTQLGWTGEIAKKAEQSVPVIPPSRSNSPDAHRRDLLTRIGRPLSLEEHTGNVLRHMSSLTALSPSHDSPLTTAVRWHDVGKALDDFQSMLRDASGQDAPTDILAKSGETGGTMPENRRHFRHELASALAWLAHHDGEPQADLVAYLIAAHHGKVRLSIRSLPDEKGDEKDPERLFARGILDQDKLPPIPGLTETETVLSLDLMRMGADEKGRPSWLARMIALRDQIGPFHLAYLETLLRAADMRASAEEANSLPFGNAEPANA